MTDVSVVRSDVTTYVLLLLLTLLLILLPNLNLIPNRTYSAGGILDSATSLYNRGSLGIMHVR